MRITTHGLVYTTLSRVKINESFYLLNELNHRNIHVKQKLVDEINRLTTNALSRLERVPTTNSFKNNLPIATLNTCSLQAHIEDLMNSMVICFQETHLKNIPRNNPLCKFNLKIARSVHGFLTCIDKTIQT